MKSLKIILIVLLLNGCSMWTSYPDKDDWKQAACYQANMCLYYNKTNPDKTICAKAIETCMRILVMEYCKQYEDKNDCWKAIQ